MKGKNRTSIITVLLVGLYYTGTYYNVYHKAAKYIGTLVFFILFIPYLIVVSIEGYNKDKKLISDENITKYKNELTDHIKEDENRNARRT